MCEKKKIVIDSCVYLSVMLEETGLEECQKEIDETNEKENLELCITSPIIYETLKRARGEAEKIAEKRNDIIEEKKKKEIERHYDYLMETFLQLTKNAYLLSNKGEKFPEIKKKVGRCLNEKKDSRDIINLAISINNKVCSFVTRENAINNSKNQIEKISRKHCQEKMEIKKI